MRTYERPKVKEFGWWIFISATVIFLVVLVINPWIHTDWNGGKCKYDGVHYSLKEVNERRYTYICPVCNYEITIRK